MSMAYASVRLLCCGLASASLLSGHASTQPLSLASLLPTEWSTCPPFDYSRTLDELALRLTRGEDRGAGALEDFFAEDGEVIERVCRVTAYHDRGITAAGVPSGVGQCAAPADIPFGARVYIPALDRWFIVTDRTHKRFRHNTVDLFITSRAECLKFGRHYLECRFELPKEKVRYGQLRLSMIRELLRQSERS